MIKITLPDGHYYDEMLTAQGEQRPHYNAWWQWFRNTDQFSIRQKKAQAELLFHRIGITFNVYGEDEGTERLIPFDSVPRIIPAGEWQRIDRGDVYKRQVMRYAVVVSYANGAGALLRTFSSNRQDAIEEINDLDADEFFEHVVKKHPAPQAPRYIWKLQKALDAM